MIYTINEKSLTKCLEGLQGEDICKVSPFDFWKKENKDSLMTKENMMRLSELSERIMRVGEKSQLEEFSLDDILEAMEFIPVQSQLEEILEPHLLSKLVPGIWSRIEGKHSVRNNKRRVF